MSARVNAAWLVPVSTDPALLVDRGAELDDLVGWLEEQRAAQIREGHFLISGARGVGKSIFTKAALRRFEAMHPDQVVCVIVDSRGLGYRPFLNRLAQHLSDAIRPHAERGKRREILKWLDQLALLSSANQISRAQTESIARRYGADASVGADLLLKLQSKFVWEESRSLGQTLQTTLAITDELLHAAITATLERLAEPDSRWMIVVFFDDLDQVAIRGREEDIASLFRKVLDLRPCLSLVHFRTDALIDDVVREALDELDLPPLSPPILFEMVERRLNAANEVVRGQLPATTDWSAAHRLAACTGNPLVFLRWLHALLRMVEWPLPAGWATLETLERVALRASPVKGADPALVRRLVEIVDRCDGGRPDQVLQRADLLRGCAALDPSPPADKLTEQEIDLLERLRALLPRYRYDPSSGFRIEPTLDLLRPSVRARI